MDFLVGTLIPTDPDVIRIKETVNRHFEDVWNGGLGFNLVYEDLLLT